MNLKTFNALLNGSSAVSLIAQRAERQPHRPVAGMKARRQGLSAASHRETVPSDQT